MDLTAYKLEDLLLSAIKSEIDCRDLYAEQASRTTSVFLRDRLGLLSKEEDKHRTILERLFNKLFPGESLIIPETTPISILDFDIKAGEMQVSEVLEVAMQAELTARDYYLSLKNILLDHSAIAMTLEYLAAMELGHYRILELERDNRILEEEFDSYWKDFNVQ